MNELTKIIGLADCIKHAHIIAGEPEITTSKFWQVHVPRIHTIADKRIIATQIMLSLITLNDCRYYFINTLSKFLKFMISKFSPCFADFRVQLAMPYAVWQHVFCLVWCFFGTAGTFSHYLGTYWQSRNSR